MKTFSTVVIIVFALLSCKNNNTTYEVNADSLAKNTDEIKVIPKPELVTEEQCYRFVAARDIYDIKFTCAGDIVHGKMAFNNFEKDDSYGTFTGKIDGDILKAIYKFQSEGMNSISEIYLKLDGDQLITGNGEQDVIGDSAFIKNPAALKYDNSIVYKKVDCKTMKL